MKAYFLNIGTGTIHKTTCFHKKQLNNENYREFSSLEEIVESTDKYVKVCKNCMRDETENWKKLFGQHE